MWFGFDAAALAGAVVPDGCIIGFRSVVTASSKLERHTLAVGQPARIAKRYVTFAKNGNPPADTIDLSMYPEAATLYEDFPLNAPARASGRFARVAQGLRLLAARLDR